MRSSEASISWGPGVWKSLIGCPGGLERQDIRSGHGGGAWHHRHEQIVVMVHRGSRGFGHQVASDYLKVFEKSMRRYGITVKDQQLACVPFRSSEGQDYFSAMNCAANTAVANRQVITHQIRGAFVTVFGRSAEALGMEVVYDVAHNIAKVERYPEGDLVVHRKGGTRAFGPGSPELPEMLR